MSAPAAEVTTVMAPSGTSRRARSILARANRAVADTVMKRTANMLVATACRGVIPTVIISGTLMSELPPVIAPSAPVATMRALSSTICATLIAAALITQRPRHRADVTKKMHHPRCEFFSHSRRRPGSSRVTAMDGRRALSVWLAVVALAVAGCGGQASEPTAPALVFTGRAGADRGLGARGSSTSASGGPPPSRPSATTPPSWRSPTARGAPVAGLTLTIVPFMPAHGHGASVDPTVSETAPGIYVATPLDFFMAGNWELMTAISRTAQAGSDGGAGDAGAGGAIDDSAEPTVDVP